MLMMVILGQPGPEPGQEILAKIGALCLGVYMMEVPNSFNELQSLRTRFSIMSSTITADEFTNITSRQKQINFHSAKHFEVDQRVLEGLRISCGITEWWTELLQRCQKAPRSFL